MHRNLYLEAMGTEETVEEYFAFIEGNNEQNVLGQFNPEGCRK